MLSGVLSGLHTLQLALGAHILSTLGEPLLHDESALLSSLDGRVSTRSWLILVLAGLCLARWRSADSLVLTDSGEGTLAVCLAMVD